MRMVEDGITTTNILENIGILVITIVWLSCLFATQLQKDVYLFCKITIVKLNVLPILHSLSGCD